MLKIVGIIPARLASKRFPKKVLADILGKSLLQRTYENALKCEVLDKVIIAADEPEVMAHVENFGGEAVMTGRHINGSDRVAEVVARDLEDAEIVVNIQADEPCLDPRVIDALVRELQEDSSAVMTTPITKIVNPAHIFDPSIVKCVFDENNRALYFSRAPIPFPQVTDTIHDYYRHIGVYCFRAPFLLEYASLSKTRLQQIEDLEQLRVLEHGYPVHVCEVEDQMAGVDTLEDLEKVREHLCKNTSLSQEALSLH